MSPAMLALIVAVGLLGPLLAWSDRVRIPVVIGELVAGVIIGHTGFRLVDTTDATFVFVANLGFAMMMFTAGTHVPIRDKALRAGAQASLLRLLIVVALAMGLGWGTSQLFATGHAGLYTVLFASSSAAVILPIAGSLKLPAASMVRILPQVAVADAACIVALPLALDPAHAGRAALGALAVIACGVVIYWLLWQAESRGWRRALHDKSGRRDFALELRISLLLLLLLVALAQQTKVSIMLAGFCLGLVVAAVGQTRRLARQMFGLTEGLFAPAFYVWLGASLNLRDLGAHPSMIVLGVALALAAVLAHAGAALARQPLTLAVLAGAQLGVPVAAATLGDQLGLLAPGEDAALLLGALLTIVVATVAGVLSLRAAPPDQPRHGTSHRQRGIHKAQAVDPSTKEPAARQSAHVDRPSAG